MAQNGLHFYQVVTSPRERVQIVSMQPLHFHQYQQQIAQNGEIRSGPVQQQQIRQVTAAAAARRPPSPRAQTPEPHIPQMRRITIVTDLRDLKHPCILRKPFSDEKTWGDFLESCRLRFDNKVHKVIARRKVVKLTDKIHEAGFLRKEFSIKIVARLPRDQEAVRQRAFRVGERQRREQQQAAAALAAAGAGARPGGAPPDEYGNHPMMEDYNPSSPGNQSACSSMVEEYEEPDEAVAKSQFVENALSHHGRTFTQMRDRLDETLRLDPKKFIRRVGEQPEVYLVLMTWLLRYGRTGR